jgi:hypothetical protein
MHNHGPDDPPCEVCEHGVEAYLAKQQALMEQYGWVWHYTQHETDPTKANIHTHGFDTKFNHLDVQITLPCSPKIAQTVLNGVVNKLEKGVTFKDGDIATEVIGNNFKVMFVKKQESDRDVLRIILPDPDGNLLQEFQSKEYAAQWDD